MFRFVLAGAVALVPLAFAAGAQAQTEQQALVDRATLTVQDLVGGGDGGDRVDTLKRARAVMVCPRVFRLSFILGAEGGGCVLSARDGSGSWSDPAFYGLGSGSVGLQIGLQDSEVLMMVLTEKGLAAVMDNQFKLGGDASISVVTIGVGVQAATTAALSGDIVAFSRGRGLYAGASLAGSVMSTRTDWNNAYYGRDLAARQIVMEMQANNPGADPLRAVLGKYGTP